MERLRAALERQLLPHLPKRLGVAVSGGGDSVALLCLVADFAKVHNLEVHAISIDHGIRKAAREEIRSVSRLCAELGVPHHVEYWRGWDGKGNLQDQARMARYELMAGWAEQNDVRHIVVGHTANDQAETLMMRLMRGSGVDGLSAMSSRRVQHGVSWIRPLLSVQRDELRRFLEERGVPWIEDPSNENLRFERVRVRKAMELLEPLGLTTETLLQVSENMTMARDALDWQTFLAARDCAEVILGSVAFDLQRVLALPREIARRLLVRGLLWVSGADYPPRRDVVMRAITALREGRNMTLEGCQLTHDKGVLWIHREYNAVAELTAEVGDLWDERWTITGSEDDPDLLVRALGEDGLGRVEDWRSYEMPRSAVLSLPSVWQGDEVAAVPLLRGTDDWQFALESGADGFFAALLSH